MLYLVGVLQKMVGYKLFIIKQFILIINVFVGSTSDILMVALVPIMDRMECERILRMHRLSLPITLGQICAGGKDLVDTCRGDSGGPLGYRDFYNGNPRFIQFGIVSFGLQKCGVVNVPGVYTNVSHYIQWITDNLRESKSIINNVKLDEGKLSR